MKVTFVTEYYPFYAAKVIQEIGRHLAKMGCSVVVLSSNISFDKELRFNAGEEYIDNVKVIRFDAFPIEIASSSYVLYNPMKFQNMFRCLKREINDAEVLHLHTGHGILTAVSAAVFRTANRRTSMIYTSHGVGVGRHNSFVLDIGNIFFRKVIKSFIINNCKFITSVAFQDLGFWIKQGVPRERMCYIPNGVDARIFGPSDSRGHSYREKMEIPNDNIVVLFSAQFRKVKGIDVLLEAIPKVVSRIPDISFVLSGAGPMLPYVESFINMHGLKNSTRLLSYYVPEKEMPLLFNLCDIYVLPSFIEAMPLSLMEAMACGKPVIVTSVGDVPVLVKNGINGIVIPSGSADLLAEGIIQLARNPRLRNIMGEANATKMKQYDWGEIAKEYLSLYSKMVNG